MTEGSKVMKARTRELIDTYEKELFVDQLPLADACLGVLSRSDCAVQIPRILVLKTEGRTEAGLDAILERVEEMLRTPSYQTQISHACVDWLMQDGMGIFHTDYFGLPPCYILSEMYGWNQWITLHDQARRYPQYAHNFCDGLVELFGEERFSSALARRLSLKEMIVGTINAAEEDEKRVQQEGKAKGMAHMEVIDRVELGLIEAGEMTTSDGSEEGDIRVLNTFSKAMERKFLRYQMKAHELRGIPFMICQ